MRVAEEAFGKDLAVTGDVTSEADVSRATDEVEEFLENMHPMGCSGKPEEVAAGVWYLCNDATWSTGQGLVMDGGFTVP